MKETIYYMSDVKWYSKTSAKYATKLDALKAHIRYVESSKDFVFSTSNKNILFENATKANKRINSAISFTFILAIPNDLDYDGAKYWADKVRNILSETLKVDKSTIYIGYHNSKGISKIGNKHFHVAVPNLDINGKALRVKPETLKSLHMSFQNLLVSHGYHIIKDQDPLPKLGPGLRYDEEARRDYLAMVETKQAYRKIYAELQEKKKDKNIKILHNNLAIIEKKLAYLKQHQALTSDVAKLYQEFKELTNKEIEKIRTAGKGDVKAYNTAHSTLIETIQRTIDGIKHHSTTTSTHLQHNTNYSANISSQTMQPGAPSPAPKPPSPSTKSQATKKQDNKSQESQEGNNKPKPKLQEQSHAPKSTISQDIIQALKQRHEIIRSQIQLSQKQKQSQKPTQSPQINEPDKQAYKPDQSQVQKPQPQAPNPESQQVMQETRDAEKQKKGYILLYSNTEMAEEYWEANGKIEEYEYAKAYKLPDQLSDNHIKKILEMIQDNDMDILITPDYLSGDNQKLLDYDDILDRIYVVEQSDDKSEIKPDKEKYSHQNRLGPAM